MKVSSLIAAILFASTAITSTAYADDKAATPKAGEAKMDKTESKRHSPVQEKMGMPQSMPDAKADKPNAAKDKSKHFHPRDGK